MKSSRSSIVVAAGLLLLTSLACSDRMAPDDRQAGGEAARSAGVPTGYRVLPLPTLGGERGRAGGINERNEVVGMAENADGEPRAFRWHSGSIEELPGLGGSISAASAINNAGLIVGQAENAEGHLRAVLWRNGSPVDLGTLGGSFSQAQAVNERGQVVGRATNAAGEMRPFLWWRGRMEELPLPPHEELFFGSANGINNRGQVVGSRAGVFVDATTQHALIWTRGQVGILEAPCAQYGVSDINEREQVVGGGLDCPVGAGPLAPDVLPILFEKGTFSGLLEPLGGFATEFGQEFGIFKSGVAFAVNARGHIVGRSDVEHFDSRATLWYQDQVVDLGGGSGSSAADINNRAVAVGQRNGVPAIFIPDSERELTAEFGSAESDRRAGEAETGGYLGTALFGTRATEGWVLATCQLRRGEGVDGPQNLAEILAGC